MLSHSRKTIQRSDLPADNGRFPGGFGKCLRALRRRAAFAAHYGTVILPTEPYTARHKGKVERGIDYVQGNALKGKQFHALEEQNRHLRDWEAGVADTRIHATTRQHVGRVFREVEQPALRALSNQRFPNFYEAQRAVNRDGHVEVAKAYYSGNSRLVAPT